MIIQDDKFWDKVRIDCISHCWEYTGARDKKGYGKIKRRKLSNNSWILAHRYAFYLKHGRFPEPFACHHCDNPICVNPDHLFEGTNADNQKDCWQKGRAKFQKLIHKGENNGNSKLTALDVAKIKRLLPQLSNKRLASQYNVTHHAISNIRTGKTWK